MSNLPKTENSPIEVVRLNRQAWKDVQGRMHSRVSLIPLRRLSSGTQVLEEDCSMIGVEQVMDNIVNLAFCPDGIYQVELVNGQKDWETGTIDSYDYKLVPYVRLS